MGIRIYRFYIKCTRCLQEISFKTDPRNTDYEIEEGATRNFMALKLAQEQEKREVDAEKEEEATNPMKLLENRTQQSKQEIELMESLEELRDLNRRQGNVDYDSMLLKYNPTELKEQIKRMQEEEDENTVQKLMGIKRKINEYEDEEVLESEELVEPEDNITKSKIKNVITTAAQCSVKKKVSKLNHLNLVKVNIVTGTNKTKESCNSLSLIGNYSSSDDSN